ncbi:MAG TPA: YihA family ribosome biogenesis GTP-binding protein [Bacteroidetes bacterium]|nr:YihA family ribosome biogenesis GTP-binding protein [Bacteroidota bacterium]
MKSFLATFAAPFNHSHQPALSGGIYYLPEKGRQQNGLEILQTKYIGSFPALAKCPEPVKPEFAFIGRSNVGKSSLINMLCNRRNLAHVSKKPGKTEAINFFEVNGQWYLIDLPGYGYAVRSKGMKKSFRDMIYSYLVKRRSLACTFVLIDVNVPPQKNDLAFIDWLGENGVPFVIVYTKTDRLTKKKLAESVSAIQQALLENWSELPRQFYSSSPKKEGRNEILTFIKEVVDSLVD